MLHNNGYGISEYYHEPVGPVFSHPFNELLVWSVLTRRHSMAILMWQHGEEALAKALVASKLLRAMANEAADDDLEVEICDELRGYAVEFDNLAVEFIDYCYRLVYLKYLGIEYLIKIFSDFFFKPLQVFFYFLIFFKNLYRFLKTRRGSFIFRFFLNLFRFFLLNDYFKNLFNLIFNQFKDAFLPIRTC